MITIMHCLFFNLTTHTQIFGFCHHMKIQLYKTNVVGMVKVYIIIKLLCVVNYAVVSQKVQ